MKTCCFLLSAAAIGTIFAYGQQNIPQVQHVMVVIQENRTPDNLFGSDAFAAPHQLPGADLVTTTTQNCVLTGQPLPLAHLYLDTCFDPYHGHNLPSDSAWITTYDGGAMDGACNVPYVNPSGCTQPSNGYPQVTYVDNSTSVVQPYFDIAARWGFANYMFQTNQGPSFEAHQFLFSGTSAPDSFNDASGQNCAGYPCWQWFAAENVSNTGAWGCSGTSDTIYDISPAIPPVESPVYLMPNPPTGTSPGYPCYTHNAMATLLEHNDYQPVSWAYYPQGPDWRTSLWTAPNAISAICPLDPVSGLCTGSEWGTHVANHAPQTGNLTPILSDINNCSLQKVSWVIPDGVWSDHPGCPQGGCTVNGGQRSGHDRGPSWVAAIVNAVGQSTTCDSGTGYWNNTVILITWDDWGGFYDHISPATPNLPGIGYSNQSGKNYVYGFRVPLLAVSAYDVVDTVGAQPTGHISGRCGISGYPNCPDLQGSYVHDFGSILNFIEYVFGTGGNALRFANQTPYSGISPQYPYADALAPDGQTTCGSTCPYGLSDFFNFHQAPAPFGSPTSAPYGPEWFTNFGSGPGYPASADPDNDAVPPTAVPPVP